MTCDLLALILALWQHLDAMAVRLEVVLMKQGLGVLMMNSLAFARSRSTGSRKK